MIKTFSQVIVVAGAVMLSACAATRSVPKASPPEAQSESAAKPSTPPVAIDCNELPALVAEASEISVDDIKMNEYSRYQLVSAQVHFRTDFIPEKKNLRAMVSLKFSVNASVENPDILPSVNCKSMADAPDGELTGDISAPMQISTSDGTLSGNAVLRFKLYGKNATAPDELKPYSSKQPKYSTVLDLKTALKNEGDVHFYRISESQIELRASQTKSNSNMTYLVSIRQIFEAVR